MIIIIINMTNIINNNNVRQICTARSRGARCVARDTIPSSAALPLGASTGQLRMTHGISRLAPSTECAFYARCTSHRACSLGILRASRWCIQRYVFCSVSRAHRLLHFPDLSRRRLSARGCT